jgi:hypothetical protein
LACSRRTENRCFLAQSRNLLGRRHLWPRLSSDAGDKLLLVVVYLSREVCVFVLLALCEVNVLVVKWSCTVVIYPGRARGRLGQAREHGSKVGLDRTTSFV